MCLAGVRCLVQRNTQKQEGFGQLGGTMNVVKQPYGESRWKMSANGTLRLLREQRNLSIQDVADAVGVSFRTVLRAEQGAPLNPETQQLLCAFYGKTSEELGLVPRRRRAEKGPSSVVTREYQLTSTRDTNGR